MHYLYRRASLPEPSSILVVEKESRVGGALKGFALRDPVTLQYRSGTPMRVGLGAQRSGGTLSYHEQRCLTDELEIVAEGSPFRGTYTNRGAKVTCSAPAWSGPDQPADPYDASPFAWSDNCSEDPVWKGNGTCPGRYLNVTLSESSTYNWLTGYSNVHPTTGSVCAPVSSSCGIDQACSPAGKRADISFFFKTQFNSNEDAAFLRDFNYGFQGDFINGVSACNWAEWTQREWDTTSTFFYPRGGMEELVLRMLSRAQQQSAARGHRLSVWTETAAEEIWRNPGPAAGTHPYRVLVRNATGTRWVAARRVLLAVGSTPVSRLRGDLGAALAADTHVRQVSEPTPMKRRADL